MSKLNHENKKIKILKLKKIGHQLHTSEAGTPFFSDHFDPFFGGRPIYPEHTVKMLKLLDKRKLELIEQEILDYYCSM